MLTKNPSPGILFSMDTAQKLTVSELTDYIRRCLESNFATLVVEGEISNCRPSSTGHLYFTLKDPSAAISAVMFANRFRTLGIEPRDGMLVRVRGRLSVYPQRGTYQIVCEEMELAGAGDILAMLEKRKRLLAAEGLFDEERKKPIPRFPETIGVISSPTGAAVRDILNILKRRAAGVSVIILPPPVQGQEAAPAIARRIEQANRWTLADVLIVGRGGGALEDLLPFSEEEVVRAVAASAIPVVSAVGHEIDWALTDFAADLRAPTPSAAAELVSENREAVLEEIRKTAEHMGHIVRARLERAKLLLKPFSLSDLEYRFRSILQPRLVRFDDAREALIRALVDRVREVKGRLELAVKVLEAASPAAILRRGFSVVTTETDGKSRVVRRAADVQSGDRITIRPMEGLVAATVDKAGRTI
jgi:exodeoxyribonuclease VII large subunit